MAGLPRPPQVEEVAWLLVRGVALMYQPCESRRMAVAPLGAQEYESWLCPREVIGVGLEEV